MPNSDFLSDTNTELPYRVEMASESGVKVHSRHATPGEAWTVVLENTPTDGATFTAFDSDNVEITEAYLSKTSDRFEDMTAHLAP